MAPYATKSQAQEFYAGQDGDDLSIKIVMGSAARTVSSLSDAPADLTLLPDYKEAAAHAELLVGRWIWRSDFGGLSSKGSVAGTTASKSYRSVKDVRDLVASAMGDYYSGDEIAGEAESKDAGKAYVGRLRSRR